MGWYETRTTIVHGDERTVKKLPLCEFPHRDKKILARYDARTVKGPWRMMCRAHMREHGIGIGLGLGQRLWLAKEKHVPGEVPICELPPMRSEFAPAQAPCGRCGHRWFRHALGYRGFVGYCPICVRQLPDREHGPFTFGDVLVIEYPSGGAADPGEYLASVNVFPCEGAMRVRFAYEDIDESPEDVQLFRDGMSTWWDLDYGVSGLEVRLATAREDKEWHRRRNAYYAQFATGRMSYAQLDDGYLAS
jgi:hypothetical protein